MFVEKERGLLLVVDMQERLLPAICNTQEVEENIVRLLALAKTYQLPVLLTEQYPKGLGRMVEGLKKELGDLYSPIEKVTFSCMGNNTFRDRIFQLKRDGRDQVVVTGIEAHVCVYQTVMHLLTQGWEVHLASDGVGSRVQRNHLWALDIMDTAGAWIKPTETIVFEVLEQAGTPQFKAMLPYIK
jgi:nicotinamidase-related amidase